VAATLSSIVLRLRSCLLDVSAACSKSRDRSVFLVSVVAGELSFLRLDGVLGVDFADFLRDDGVSTSCSSSSASDELWPGPSWMLLDSESDPLALSSFSSTSASDGNGGTLSFLAFDCFFLAGDSEFAVEAFAAAFLFLLLLPMREEKPAVRVWGRVT
jgi:hypothetical protein